MDCQVCSEEIPGDSLFCPECGARQDPSKSGAMGGRNFGVVSSQAVQATHDMQAADAAGGSNTGPAPAGFLNQIADQMAAGPQPAPAQPTPAVDPSSMTDQVVNHIVETERAEKAGARNEWLAMNQKTASGVLAGLAGGDVPDHLATSSGSAKFLDDGQDIDLEKKRVKSNQPSPSLLRRMAEVATRRVARKRGVAVESPQVAMTEDDTIQVNVTYIDDGRVLDTPPDLSNAFEHAIATELALKGFDIGIEIALFRSMDGKIELVWGESVGADEDDEIDDDEDLFACDDCGHYPIRESDPSCAGCGAQFIDDDDWDDTPSTPSRGPSGPPNRGPSGGGPPNRGPSGGGPPNRGPSGGPGGPPRGPSRGPSGPPKGPSRGPSSGGPPSRGPSDPPSKGPGGGPPSKGPSGGPPSRGPSGGPPSKGPGGGPPSRGPPRGPGGPPKRKGPPR